MAVTDPYPGQPTDGQSLDAVPILAKFNALFQGIQSFDGSQIQAGSVAASALATSVNPNTLLHDTIQPFIQTGLVWSQVSGLQGTMTSGVAYIANASSMFRVSITGVGSYTFTASKDTYIDIDYNGNVYYQAVANNATSPSITANAIRVAIVITNASAIVFINQGQTNTSLANFGPTIGSNAITVSDALGNLIYPTNPYGGVVGYRQITGNFSTTSSSPVAVTGLSCPVIIPATRKAKIKFFFSDLNSSSPGGYMNATLWDGAVGGTEISRAQHNVSQAPVIPEAIVYSTATTKTYNAALTSNGSAQALLEATGTFPAFISVELE